MKVRRYLRQFRRNLEAGDQVTLVTDNGIKTVQIVSIVGNKFTYFDSDLNQKVDLVKYLIPYCGTDEAMNRQGNERYPFSLHE